MWRFVAYGYLINKQLNRTILEYPSRRLGVAWCEEGLTVRGFSIDAQPWTMRLVVRHSVRSVSHSINYPIRSGTTHGNLPCGALPRPVNRTPLTRGGSTSRSRHPRSTLDPRIFVHATIDRTRAGTSDVQVPRQYGRSSNSRNSSRGRTRWPSPIDVRRVGTHRNVVTLLEIGRSPPAAPYDLSNAWARAVTREYAWYIMFFAQTIEHFGRYTVRVMC